MPVLPIIDLLIFLGWTTLAAGGILKAIYIATSYRPTLLSLTPLDLLFVALALLGLALTLAARTWVRLNEPELVARRRANTSRQAVERARAQDTGVPRPVAEPQLPVAPAASAASGTIEDGLRGEPGHWQRIR